MVIFRINKDFLKQVLVENNWKLVLNSSREGKKFNSRKVFISIANKNQGKEYCSLHWLYWKDPYNVWICLLIGITGRFTSFGNRDQLLSKRWHNYQWSKPYFINRCCYFLFHQMKFLRIQDRCQESQARNMVKLSTYLDLLSWSYILIYEPWKYSIL